MMETDELDPKRENRHTAGSATMASGRSSPCGSTTTGPSQSFGVRIRAEAVESGYDWATDHERTIEALESFLTSRRKRKGSRTRR